MCSSPSLYTETRPLSPSVANQIIPVCKSNLQRPIRETLDSSQRRTRRAKSVQGRSLTTSQFSKNPKLGTKFQHEASHRSTLHCLEISGGVHFPVLPRGPGSRRRHLRTIARGYRKQIQRCTVQKIRAAECAIMI
uniref:Uncharacterized protein n=1 Tax=Physcomitrium patens TaxID=3218 RepID=A0A7I3ZAD4_PHYPA